ncbi:MAG: hypothetical protein Q9170_000607 [Blastenia crenularia]
MNLDGQQVSEAVPRFASFRSDILPGAAPGQSDGRQLKKPLSPKEYHHRSGRRCHHANKRRSPAPSVAPGHDAPFNSPQQYDEWGEPATTIAIDVKGDARNLEYGSSYGVPLYSRFFIRVAVGSHSSAGSIFRQPTSIDQGRSSLSKQCVSGLRHKDVRRINGVSHSDFDHDGRADYIPLSCPKPQKRSRGDWTEDGISCSPIEYSMYHHVEGKDRPASFPDEGVEDIEDDMDEIESDQEDARLPMIDKYLQQKRASLSRQVEQNPNSWHLWVELVQLQNEMDGFFDDSSHSSRLRHTIAERRSNSEIVLSMYETALRSVVDLAGREQLHLGLMSKAPEVWERGKTLSKWELVLKEHPSSHRLWKRFLDFQQSTFSGFSLEETRKQYLDSLETLQGICERADLEQAQRSKIFDVQVYILLRLTLLLREGGYTELAVAMWQALLEFHFLKPAYLGFTSQQEAIKLAPDQSLLAFEQFWDSETPRIGESNARGWLNFNGIDSDQGQLLRTAESPTQADGVFPRLWAVAERKVSSKTYTPGRTVDESSGDPFRVVLFSDIKPALIQCPTSDPHITLSAFLCFCQLPPYDIKSWYHDQFVRNELLHQSMSEAFRFDKPNDMSSRTGQHENSDHNPSSSSPRRLTFPLAEYQVSSDTLFSTSDEWFSAFGAWARSTGPIAIDFIFGALKTLLNNQVGCDDLVAEYVLALELHISPATVRRSAKQLLKTRPSSLRFYNTYALIQRQLGKHEESSTAIDTAIRMASKLDKEAQRDVILLWRSRIWQYFSKGETSKALGQLLGFEPYNDLGERLGEIHSRPEAISTTSHLRSQNQAIMIGRDQMLSLDLSTHAVYYTELLVLLKYLSTGTCLQAAHESFQENLKTLIANARTNRAPEELFRQCFARLLHTHVTHKYPYSPSTIRSFLTESIATFPHNTIFLSLYAWNESRFRIDDRVRDIMRDVVLAHRYHHECEENQAASDNIIPHFFAVYTDLHRGVAQGSNQNAVRGSFERALQSESAAHSASLWKLYVMFEYEHGDMKRTRDVFYRALRACPWVKDLYMLAFEYFGDHMHEAELRGVYELMVEKDLRIHVPL